MVICTRSEGVLGNGIAPGAGLRRSTASAFRRIGTGHDSVRAVIDKPVADAWSSKEVKQTVTKHAGVNDPLDAPFMEPPSLAWAG